MALSRKKIIEAANDSLKRLDIEYADIIFAHAYDPEVSVEEVCEAFNQLIEDGKIFYWGTSSWPTSAIIKAHGYCKRSNLVGPLAEQC